MNRTLARNAIRAIVVCFAASTSTLQAAYVVRLESHDSSAAIALLEDAAGREGIRLTATAQGVLRAYNYWPEAEYARRQFTERLGLGLKVAATTDPAALGPVSDVADGLEPVIRTDVASVELPDPTGDEDRFATKGERWDMKERALKWLHAYAQQRNDTEKMALYRDMLAARTGKGVAEQ
jgi:hypothetical protein